MVALKQHVWLPDEEESVHWVHSSLRDGSQVARQLLVQIHPL
jgi:hypothetical protein